MTEQVRVESDYDRRSRERREADELDRRNKLEYIEKYIAPLRVEPVNQGDEGAARRPFNEDESNGGVASSGEHQNFQFC